MFDLRFCKVFMIFTGLETASVSKSNPPFMFMSFLKMFVKIVKIFSKKTKELYHKINDEKECASDLRNDFIPLSYGKILDKKERNDCRVPSV